MKLKRYSLAEQAYQALLKQIISGERPVGEKLTEEELCGAFGISRTPAREALVSLERDGLVERQPHSGWNVSAPDCQQIKELFECRREIECLALDAAMRKIPREKLENLKKLLLDESKEVRERSYDADQELHSLIAEYCGNRYLREILERLIRQTAPYRLYRTSGSFPEALLQERLELVESIISGNANEAVKRLSSHIEHGSRIFGKEEL